MKATSIKQIKFNRGQVSDLLSERMDMGLQNACGTVYDNIYINRYGQIENAPVIRLSSNGVKNNETKIFMLFDTGTDLVLPVGIKYSSSTVPFYAWERTPSITVKVGLKSQHEYSQYRYFTQNCPRNEAHDYTSGGINYYAWTCNRKEEWIGTDSLGNVITRVAKIDYIYTTSLNPAVGDEIIVHTIQLTNTSIKTKQITNVGDRIVVYTKTLTPNTTSEVFDSSLNYIGNAYSSSDDVMTYDGYKYDRNSELDTSQGASKSICVYSPLSKTDNSSTTDLTTPIATGAVIGDIPIKNYQFGYNVVLFDQNTAPILFNITPGTNGWYNPTLSVKENYFTDSFNNIYVRGLNVATPVDFTVPTSGQYKIENSQTQITTKLVVKVQRNGAGGAFTQSLVGQVIQSPANGGALQVRSVEDGDNLTAYVLAPMMALSTTATDIRIPWSGGESARWVFGYESAYSPTAGYPDSAIYVNQRLIFGGNDTHGALISASRIGVVNDFDPESGTESDAFTTSIAAKDFVRVIDFVVSNNELRIACTNGEYAMNLANLTPTGSLNGFDLRSEVGIKKGTPICDCGGITAYVSNDGNSIYATQFSLLRDRYQPVSLTSQTDNLISQCIRLKYLKNRGNNEGNLLVGLNEDGTLFGTGIDTNSGLIGAFKMNGYNFNIDNVSLKISELFCADWALWGLINITEFNNPAEYKQYIVRFARQEFFNLPSGLTIPTDIAQFINQDGIYFRGLLQSGTGFDLVTPTSITDNEDGTSTVSFGDNDDSIFVAGFLRQADWRSVEIGIGIATRELNKNIVKLSAVIKPQEFWNWTHTVMGTIDLSDFGKFFNLVRGRGLETIQEQFIVKQPLDIYGENGTMIWRRAFDNPSREMHYGITAIAPFLVKSITATVQYDEIA